MIILINILFKSTLFETSLSKFSLFDSDINEIVNRIYFTLEQVITFNNNKKYKSILSEFIIVRSNWSDHFSDLILEIL